MTDFNDKQVAVIQSRFERAGCSVASLGPQSFQIVSKAFPVLTRVVVSSFFYQFETVITARPKIGLPSGQSQLHAFLNESNFRAKAIKLFSDPACATSPEGEWLIFAIFRPTTGILGCDFDSSALENLLTLWNQDIAELIMEPSPFSLRAMMVDP